MRRPRQSLGATFSLRPHSRRAIRRRFPQATQASSLSIEFGTQTNFQQTYGAIWDNVARTLSGWSLGQLAELGGYRVYDLGAESIVHESAPEMVA